MPKQSSRRQVLTGATAAAGAAVMAPLLTRPGSAKGNHAPVTHPSNKASSRPAAEPFGYCLNTSTINNSTVPAPEQFEIAAKAGFSAVEPWIGDLDKYEKKGGS